MTPRHESWSWNRAGSFKRCDPERSTSRGRPSLPPYPASSGMPTRNAGGIISRHPCSRPDAAARGAFAILCSGADETYRAVQPILETAGTTRWVGPEPEQAMLVKLADTLMPRLFAGYGAISRRLAPSARSDRRTTPHNSGFHRTSVEPASVRSTVSIFRDGQQKTLECAAGRRRQTRRESPFRSGPSSTRSCRHEPRGTNDWRRHIPARRERR